jgi:aspartate kinase
MQVFKFGGVSIQNANAIKNVIGISKKYLNEPLLLVVSALGKTTNQLELVCEAYYTQQPWQNLFDKVVNDHIQIANELGIVEFEKQLLQCATEIFTKIDVSNEFKTYDFLYDQIVPFGEIAATMLLHRYFILLNINNNWLDARHIIATDNNYRDVNVDWNTTEQNVQQIFNNKIPATNSLFITQGFIGGCNNGYSTTLGREGSDFSAAIFSYCLNVNQLTIWKDVPGIMTADPKLFNDATVIKQISYLEAIEMTYFGATVIHPKSIKPIQNKGIKMCVRSFIDLNNEGTTIANFENAIAYSPIKVLKKNQVLLSFHTKDFSFIAEKHLSEIFAVLSQFRIRINLMQNGAISFSVCIDQSNQITALIDCLGAQYTILKNTNLELLTIRHYTEDTIKDMVGSRKIYLEQKTRSTVQFVL